MSNLFLDVFGEYISDPRYRDMLKDTTFTDLYIHKEDLKLTANLHFKEFKNIMCLKATANEIKIALRFKIVEFNFYLPPEALEKPYFVVADMSKMRSVQAVIDIIHSDS